jgi:hypothetical protein
MTNAQNLSKKDMSKGPSQWMIQSSKISCQYSTACKETLKAGFYIRLMKSDFALFARLYIGCEAHRADLDEFFRHENHPFLPSLSDLGSLCFGSKSDILACITDYLECSEFIRPCPEEKIVEGTVLAHMIVPCNAKAFGQYAG